MATKIIIAFISLIYSVLANAEYQPSFSFERYVKTITVHADGTDEVVEETLDKIETENKNLLADTDYPAPDAEQRALKKDYSAGPYDHAVLKNAYRSDFTVAGGKTPPAKTTNQLPQGNKSPMTNIKRQPKPATGAQPRG